jgi:hypothetical protein
LAELLSRATVSSEAAKLLSRGGWRRDLDVVRPVALSDRRDPGWRPLDEAHDQIQEPVSGVDYGDSYPQDYSELYYWRA